jgi:hypothetical protein
MRPYTGARLPTTRTPTPNQIGTIGSAMPVRYGVSAERRLIATSLASGRALPSRA